ncbi:hypothetical protein BGW38_010309 [Lunasporangiospora selenospora]|uniref:Ras modification protein ERF4 n=1 Tax=Lunasporangiospora selenospora TaxID=979761 RepID=A0A9P6KFS6_9FUNG|nr:hypothetical protein BGW38_010309 [Lunasporangiospora selenospora]
MQPSSTATPVQSSRPELSETTIAPVSPGATTINTVRSTHNLVSTSTLTTSIPTIKVPTTMTTTTMMSMDDRIERQPSSQPMGTPRCIVRIDRDHLQGDEATRFECEMFPEEFLGRVTRPEFKATVEGINDHMQIAEESLWNCLDTLLDCLTAYTAKHCFGTHYQRSLREMEKFIELENKKLYHPAKMHLRNPLKVGMIYLEFEVY